jgi:hypothetical protein
MKRFALLVCSLAVALMVPGCPIYGEDEGCSRDSDCPDGYSCDGLTGLCSPTSTVVCDAPSDCGPSETCGRDGFCHFGDCSWAATGCVAGYHCDSSGGTYRCAAGNAANGGAGGQSSGESGAGGTGAAGGAI